MGKQIVAVIFSAMVLWIPSLTYGSNVTGHLNATADVSLANSFFDGSWGMQPDKLEGAMHIVDLDQQQAVYTAGINVSPILGTVQAYSNPRLVFTKDNGLVQVLISFNDKEYNQVDKHLNDLLGEPYPIIYEIMPSKVTFEERREWRVGQNTKVVLVSRWSGTFVELSQQNPTLQLEDNFEDLFIAALLKGAREYEEGGQMLEASSICQELLNSTQSYESFTLTVQERLAAYSQHKDAVEYLGEKDGVTFSLVKNIFPDYSRQHWVRMDLDFAAQEEMKRHQPRDDDQQDNLPELSSVLCRVQADSVKGKYVVIEQIWLDNFNQIIGGRPAWMPQENSWFASYHKQICEEFLVQWFSFGTCTKQEK